MWRRPAGLEFSDVSKELDTFFFKGWGFQTREMWKRWREAIGICCASSRENTKCVNRIQSFCANVGAVYVLHP